MKMGKLSHTDVCDCGERQTMYHLMACVDAANCTWTDLAMPTLAGVNCAKHWEESIIMTEYRGLDEEELHWKPTGKTTELLCGREKSYRWS